MKKEAVNQVSCSKDFSHYKSGCHTNESFQQICIKKINLEFYLKIILQKFYRRLRGDVAEIADARTDA